MEDLTCTKHASVSTDEFTQRDILPILRLTGLTRNVWADVKWLLTSAGVSVCCI